MNHVPLVFVGGLDRAQVRVLRIFSCSPLRIKVVPGSRHFEHLPIPQDHLIIKLIFSLIGMSQQKDQDICDREYPSTIAAVFVVVAAISELY